jgi:hypothetical protein
MLAGLLLYVACSQPPVFTQISAVTVIPQGSSGTTPLNLTGEQLKAASNCLYDTAEVEKEELAPELLQEMLLVQVKDAHGDRLFELFTNENFKGNKKYYRNKCLYKLIRSST